MLSVPGTIITFPSSIFWHMDGNSDTTKRSPVSQNTRRIELLAPAGSLETFHAAIDAGADAVYLGLSDFNARLRAKNFSAKTLAFCVPYARSKKVKLYVVLNTLIKQIELENVIHVLWQLQQLRVDAVIVQDPGLIKIAREYFPRLKLHASTQMAIHNTGGILVAERLGIRRVVLSRELTFGEIESISKNTALEIEVFVHGALCYSISGMCLASSFLGGASGNRGRCTQVCRRKFSSEGHEGFFFSPDDLSLIDYLPRMQRIGVSSLKIEGRMKGAEYIHTVVSAYRKALDNHELIPEVKETLASDFGRSKTTLFSEGIRDNGIIQSSSAHGTGIHLGEITAVDGNGITVKTGEKLLGGDRVRIHPKSGFEGTSLKITGVTEKNNGEYLLTVGQTAGIHAGDTVYLVGRKSSGRQYEKRQINVRPYRFRPYCPFGRRILRKISEKSGRHLRKARHKLYIKVDSTAWLFQLQDVHCDGIIAALAREDMMKLYVNTSLLNRINDRVSLAMPPFVKEADLAKWSKVARLFYEKGVNRWFAGNIGQVPVFEKKPELVADSHIWCLNRASQSVISELGFDGSCYSVEDDFFNLKTIGNSHGYATLFAHVPLFISRIKPLIETGAVQDDSGRERYFLSAKHGLYYLVGAKPFCITHRRDRLDDCGIKKFILDLSFCECKKSLLREVLTCYNKKEKVPGSTLFNFKDGLK
ncbi:MAG: hypothetical protein GF350_17170 [Chitinivibrionales bacterium]|nr:hypothetical protein [Chitinivibrionales bacterium]